MNFKKLLFLDFIKKQVKLLITILISSYFLIFSLNVYATWQEELLEVITRIENTILPALYARGLNEQERNKCMDLLSQLRRSNNIHLTKHVLKKLTNTLDIFKEFSNSITPPPIESNDINDIILRIITITRHINSIHIYELRERIEQYFRSIEVFGDTVEQIEFFEKSSGVQLGQRVRIGFTDGSQVFYHVKTHRGGLLSTTVTGQSSAGLKEVDLKELFVYKVFERLGISPETHIFFGKGGAKDFYIATKDAGFDELTHQQKEFLTYDQLKEIDGHGNLSFLTNIRHLSTDWSNSKRRFEDAEILEGRLGPSEQNIIEELSKADILSRIFLLGDFVTNSGNFGFVLDGDTLPVFKVIDFVPPGNNVGYEALVLFDGFLAGNGMHVYSGNNDDVIRYALHRRHQRKRVETAKKIMQELTEKRLLDHDVIEQARMDIKNIISDRKKLVFIDFIAASDDLDRYVEGVQANLSRFLTNLELLYTDDYIQHILEHELGQDDRFVIIPPAVTMFTQIERDLLIEGITNAIQNARAGRVVVMPMNLHGVHWVGAVIRLDGNNNIRIIYNDPLGTPMGSDLRRAINSAAESIGIAIEDGNIVDLHLQQQQNNIDCGPFTVDNLVNIARRSDGNFSPRTLRRYEDATDIRNEHRAIIGQEIPNQLPAQHINNTSHYTTMEMLLPTNSNGSTYSSSPSSSLSTIGSSTALNLFSSSSSSGKDPIK
jgi:hypothetical protein